jgi:hypothetical protein
MLAHHASPVLSRLNERATCNSFAIGGLLFGRHWVVDRVPATLLAALADLVKWKDLQDIEGLLAAHPDADIVAVRRWVREFATAMSMSDMLDDFDKVVARSKSRH